MAGKETSIRRVEVMQMCEVQLRAGSYTPYQIAAVFPQMTQRKVNEIFSNFIFQTRGMSQTLASYVDAVRLTKSDRKVFGAQKEELAPSDKKVASSKCPASIKNWI